MNHRKSSKLPAYVYAIAGASGGISNVLLLHPMDTLKTRFQARSFSLPGSYYTSLVEAFYSIIREEGIWALYKGMGPALVGSMISWSLYFQSYHLFKSRLSSWGETSLTHFTSSTCAGIVTCLVTNPFWLVKTRLQLQVKHKKSISSDIIPSSSYRGMIHGLLSIVRQEGWIGLYRGIGPSLLLVSHGVIQLTSYEYCKTWFLYRNGDWRRQRDRTLDVTESLIASTFSKVLASTTTYPLQVIRTRMQETSPNLYNHFLQSFRCIIQMEGLKALYRGWLANLLRVTPSAALTFLTYEQVIRLYCLVFHMNE
ncbi:hypothetical protein GpartN1_g7106.t1 [Galdieria partita]|uniref:Mitochondrial carrier protein n=1 Tax=Galdieria partita TaxID=83374 RepID=A0A9C7Q3S4_9RHOD|nr:hypothetical protein GpartN1_g7106.t1 [Galdieria partita]